MKIDLSELFLLMLNEGFVDVKYNYKLVSFQ